MKARRQTNVSAASAVMSVRTCPARQPLAVAGDYVIEGRGREGRISRVEREGEGTGGKGGIGGKEREVVELTRVRGRGVLRGSELAASAGVSVSSSNRNGLSVATTPRRNNVGPPHSH
jgi:hypothetical protein